jgi:hypothetical protein
LFVGFKTQILQLHYNQYWVRENRKFVAYSREIEGNDCSFSLSLEEDKTTHQLRYLNGNGVGIESYLYMERRS